ncbi:MAG: hypothetical protein AABY01_03470, partial [Nanoarchaeota archaeon]
MCQSRFVCISFFLIAVIGLLLLALPRENFTARDILYFVVALVFYIFIISRVDSLRPVTFLLLFGIPLGLLLLREALRPNCSFDLKLPLFLLIWFSATMFASTKGIRFVMLLVPAFSIAFGAGASLISERLGRWSQSTLHITPWLIKSVVIVIFALMLIAPYQNAIAASRNDLPIMNDGWWNTLTSIHDGSDPDAIITSWWDFGHHFKYVADRKVTFDGASQNEPMAHWVGKILLTDDELLAKGLLRMLDCGSSQAFDVLDKEVNDASKSVNMIYETVKLSKTDAATYLRQHKISEPTIEAFLTNTHCDAPDAFFIASGDMIGKSGVWAHFGSWDFNRADIWVFAKKMPHAEAVDFIKLNNNVSTEVAEQLYREVMQITTEGDANAWIAPWPSYNGDLFGCDLQKDKLMCDNDIQIDLNTMDATIPVQGGLRGPPAVFAYPTKDGLVKKTYTSTAPFGLTLIPNGGRYSILLASPQLSASMFTRMYFLQGHSLQYFKPFNIQHDASSSLLYTYQMDWDGGNKTILPEMTPPVIV